MTSILAFIIGTSIYLINNNIIQIIINTNITRPPINNNKTITHIPLLHWNKTRWTSNKKQLVLSTDTQINVATVTQAWLDEYLKQYTHCGMVTVQSALKNQKGTEWYLSFNDDWLPLSISIYEKFLIIGSLIYTLHYTFPEINSIQLLINHTPWNDHYIRLDKPLPMHNIVHQLPLKCHTPLPKPFTNFYESKT